MCVLICVRVHVCPYTYVLMHQQATRRVRDALICVCLYVCPYIACPFTCVLMSSRRRTGISDALIYVSFYVSLYACHYTCALKYVSFYVSLYACHYTCVGLYQQATGGISDAWVIAKHRSVVVKYSLPTHASLVRAHVQGHTYKDTHISTHI